LAKVRCFCRNETYAYQWHDSFSGCELYRALRNGWSGWFEPGQTIAMNQCCVCQAHFDTVTRCVPICYYCCFRNVSIATNCIESFKGCEHYKITRNGGRDCFEFGQTSTNSDWIYPAPTKQLAIADHINQSIFFHHVVRYHLMIHSLTAR